MVAPKLNKITSYFIPLEYHIKLIINRNQMSNGPVWEWLCTAENSLVILLTQRSDSMTSFPHGERRHATQVAVNGDQSALESPNFPCSGLQSPYYHLRHTELFGHRKWQMGREQRKDDKGNKSRRIKLPDHLEGTGRYLTMSVEISKSCHYWVKVDRRWSVM